VGEIHDVVDLGELEFAQGRCGVGRDDFVNRLLPPEVAGEIGGKCASGVVGEAVVELRRLACGAGADKGAFFVVCR